MTAAVNARDEGKATYVARETLANLPRRCAKLLCNTGAFKPPRRPTLVLGLAKFSRALWPIGFLPL